MRVWHSKHHGGKPQSLPVQPCHSCGSTCTFFHTAAHPRCCSRPRHATTDAPADLSLFSVCCRACCPQIDDPTVFPAQFGEPFPHNFMETVRTMFKRLFRVYAHIYHSHFKQICALGEEAHLNTCFKHFIFFVKVRTRGGGQKGRAVVEHTTELSSFGRAAHGWCSSSLQ